MNNAVNPPNWRGEDYMATMRILIGAQKTAASDVPMPRKRPKRIRSLRQRSRFSAQNSLVSRCSKRTLQSIYG